MPGKSPYEAFQNFVDPFKRAIACVAVTKISHSPDGNSKMDTPHGLYVQTRDGGPIKLDGPAGLELRARLQYKIIADEREDYGPIRCTTLKYAYELRSSSGTSVLDYHWHPGGESHEESPHLHLGSTQLSEDAVLRSGHHILTGRISLEAVVRMAIELGARPKFDDWDDRLTLAEAPFKLFRTWS